MIKFVDTSHYELGFNFVKGVADGVVGMMTKASEGLGRDKTCSTLIAKARSAGIKYCGMYHFFHSNIPVQAQVKMYLSAYKQTATELPPILDLEESSVNGHSFSDVANLALEWLELVESATGKVPMLYIDMNMLALTGIGRDPRFAKYARWIAKYSSTAPPSFEFWQFTDKGEQGADTDWYNGSEADLGKFLGVA